MEHELKVQDLVGNIRRAPGKIKLDRSNTCRFTLDDNADITRIDISHFTELIEFDDVTKQLTIEPGMTMEQIVDICIPLKYMPPIITEFKHMSMGGAIIGLGGESGSFKYGLIHEQVVEYELVDADGKVHVVSKGHDLFDAIPGSYGSFGLITKLVLKCIPIKKYVHCTHMVLDNVYDIPKHIWGAHDKKNIDFIDGVAFSSTHACVVNGTMVDKVPFMSSVSSFDSSYHDFYYNYLKSSEHLSGNYMTLKDYLFRWDRGAFFNAPLRMEESNMNNIFTRMYMGNTLSCENLYKRAKRRTLVERESKKMNQDMMIRGDTFHQFMNQNIESHNSFPMWLLPITNKTDNLFGLSGVDTRYIDVGTYGYSKIQPFDFVKENRLLEESLHKNHGYKCLWNQSYYTKEEFWNVYDFKKYDALRKKYNSEKVFQCIYDKTCAMFKTFEFTGSEKHDQKVQVIQDTIQANPNSRFSVSHKKVNYQMNHGEYKKDTVTLDCSTLKDIVHVDPHNKYVYCEPGVTIHDLCMHLTKYNMIPEVIPELKNLTVGGLVQGTGLETSSFKYGQFNDTCEEYEMILGNGDIIKCSKDQHSDMFYGTSGAFGTLSIMTLLKIRIRPASPCVTLDYFSFDSIESANEELHKLCIENKYDFLEGIVFSPDHVTIMGGTLTARNTTLPMYDLEPWNAEWFAEHVENVQVQSEQFTLMQYLFRHDRGAFWTGQYARYKGVHIGQKKFVRKLLYKYFDTLTLWAKLHNKPHSEREKRFVMQDCYIDIKTTPDFVNKCNERLGIYPLWLCPVKTVNTPQLFSPHHGMNTDFMIDVGVWGVPTKFPYPFDGIALNREIEYWMKKYNGKKMFYGRAYFDKDEFYETYPYKEQYKALREKYHSERSFLEITDKIILN